MGKNVLVLEKDKLFYKKVKNYFENFNYKVYFKDTDKAIEDFIDKNNINMIIISYQLYKEKTYFLIKRLREVFNYSIILLNSKNNLSLKLKYFKIGIDDYLVKPIGINELFAIVKSKFNQEKRWNKTNKYSIKVKNISINKKEQSVFINNKLLKLSKMEFKIFKFMINKKEEVLSRKLIFENVCKSKAFGDLNNITVHINNLRKKIRNINSNFLKIETIWGFGYKLCFKENKKIS